MRKYLPCVCVFFQFNVLVVNRRKYMILWLLSSKTGSTRTFTISNGSGYYRKWAIFAHCRTCYKNDVKRMQVYSFTTILKTWDKHNFKWLFRFSRSSVEPDLQSPKPSPLWYKELLCQSPLYFYWLTFRGPSIGILPVLLWLVNSVALTSVD